MSDEREFGPFHEVVLLTDWKLEPEDLKAISQVLYDRHKSPGLRKLHAIFDTGRTVEIDSFRPLSIQKYLEDRRGS